MGPEDIYELMTRSGAAAGETDCREKVIFVSTLPRRGRYIMFVLCLSYPKSMWHACTTSDISVLQFRPTLLIQSCDVPVWSCFCVVVCSCLGVPEFVGFHWSLIDSFLCFIRLLFKRCSLICLICLSSFCFDYIKRQ